MLYLSYVVAGTLIHFNMTKNKPHEPFQEVIVSFPPYKDMTDVQRLYIHRTLVQFISPARSDIESVLSQLAQCCFETNDLKNVLALFLKQVRAEAIIRITHKVGTFNWATRFFHHALLLLEELVDVKGVGRATLCGLSTHQGTAIVQVNNKLQEVEIRDLIPLEGMIAWGCMEGLLVR
jgi:hypothetical protein